MSVLGAVVPVSVDPGATLRSLFGDPENRLRFTHDQSFLEFNRKIRHLITMADGYMLDRGELLLMINRVFHLIWDTIPLAKFPEIELFIRHNWFRVTEILDPAKHQQLMATENEYSNWFSHQERTHTPREATYGNN